MTGKILWGIIKALFWLNTAGLVISLLAPFISPDMLWVPALIGLFFKIFIVIELGFLLLFLLGRRWRLLILSFCLALVSIPAILRHIAFGKGLVDDKAQGIRIITYNVEGQSHCHDSLHPLSQEMLDHVLAQKADILFFQEFDYAVYCPTFVNALKTDGGYHYFYTTFHLSCKTKKPATGTGLAIFSKFPLFNFKRLLVVKNSSNGAMRVDMAYGKDTFRLINVHFQSVGLRKREYAIPANELDEPQLGIYKTSLRKLRNAFLKRAYQVDTVKQAVFHSPYKTILSGDFNDTPLSYTYEQMTERLRDAFLEGGSGIGSSFAGKIPFLRIDYTMISPGIQVLGARVLDWKGSDHYPVMTALKL